MIDSIFNLIFPVACILCRLPVLERRHSAVCPRCWDSLAPIQPPLCTQCGMPAVSIAGPCAACRTGDNLFDYARSAVVFDRAAREIIHHPKYSDRVTLAKPIGRLLRQTMKDGFTADIALPVPLHRSRQRERGYNQAELIAHELGLRVDAAAMRRRRKTASQTGLSRSKRIRNLAGAFELTGDMRGRRVVLVDDVMTTGATINEIAKVLKRGGVERVEVLTFARVPDAISPP